MHPKKDKVRLWFCLRYIQANLVQQTNLPIYYARMVLLRPTHPTSHDLRSNTKIKTVIPTNIKSLLGLGLKFCPIPRYTTNPTIVTSTLTRHRRDLQLKHCFLKEDHPDDNYNPRLYLKSKWMPPVWKLSKEIDRRFENFSKVYKKIMVRRPGRSNLLSFH
jgi:hypothetical protein